MSCQSASALRVLHAVRLVGFADGDAVAARAGTGVDEALRTLREAEREGWVQHLAFADLDGWSLTDLGKFENEHQLAAERERNDPHQTVAAVYRDFLPLNTRLVRAVTDWQIKPSDDDRFAPNQHSDRAWDGQVLDELTLLGNELAPLVTRLSEVLARFDGYADRYNSALRRAVNGEHDWVDKTKLDSCHRVWFQLHEDLVATLGIDRRTETPSGSA
ncbi:MULTISPECIES: transcriptional regulator [unclassified Microbacterium]|uniref:transcriptional regulator n=1 Tax=unclassified Microbacterium TaxID=2609290 RepID=UPI000EAAA309|nr:MULTISPECIES: transcriptional regulator [unclassified Microbacterium]MBT2483097.1 transcriptional regulator [Microbacterium sp. ISL-108]RKN66159.1 transcriptional regulator [Microbacterium sp. CGR2]